MSVLTKRTTVALPNVLAAPVDVAHAASAPLIKVLDITLTYTIRLFITINYLYQLNGVSELEVTPNA